MVDVHLHLDLDHGTSDMQVWSVGDGDVVRVCVGAYDDDGYTLAMTRFDLSDEEAADLFRALGKHLGLDGV